MTTIAVWFSCGAASAVAAKQTLERYSSTHTIRIINNPVIEEDDDNRSFLHDVERWLNHPIEIAINPDYPSCSTVEVWAKRNFMSGPHGAPCTIELKKKARQHWEKHNHADWHVLGFTADEHRCHQSFTETERPNVLPVLIDTGTTKQDCYRIIKDAGIDLPQLDRQGYPNSHLHRSASKPLALPTGTTSASNTPKSSWSVALNPANSSPHSSASTTNASTSTNSTPKPWDAP